MIYYPFERVFDKFSEGGKYSCARAVSIETHRPCARTCSWWAEFFVRRIRRARFHLGGASSAPGRGGSGEVSSRAEMIQGGSFWAISRDQRPSTASATGSGPKRRTAVFSGKYDGGVPWVFCRESGNDPGHRPWVLSRVVGSGGPEGEAPRRSPKAKPHQKAGQSY